MGIVIRQSIRSSVIAYIGVLIGYFNLLWLFPSFLESDQIGLVRLVQSSAILLAAFGQFGFGQSAIKFYPEQKNRQENKALLGLILTGGIFGYVLLLLTIFVFEGSITGYFSNKSALFLDYFIIVLIVTLVMVFIQLLEAYCRALLKTVAPNFIRDVLTRLFITILVLLFATGTISFDQLVFGLIFVYGTALLVLIGYLIHQGEFSPSLRFSALQNGMLKRILNYCLYTLIGTGGSQIVLQIDNVMVSGELGLDANGIYTIAFFIGVVIEMPKRAINQITMPLISRSFAKDDMREVGQFYRQTSINQLIIGALLWIGVWANLENIYSLIPNNDIYLQGMNVALFIGAGKLADMAFGVNGEIIVMSRFYRFNVLATATLAILTILLNLLLIPRFGLEGAAIASMAAMILFNIVKLIFVWVKFKIQPFTIQTLKFLVIVAVTIAANLLVPKLSNVYVDIIIRSGAITVLLIGLTFGLKISPELNRVLRDLVGRLR